MSKYQKLVDQIIILSGGKNNITKVWNCFTRLRYNVADVSLVKQDEISKLDNVLGFQFSGGHFQVVIGHDVEEVTNCMKDTLQLKVEQVQSAKRKNKALDVVFDTIAGVFTPILIAIVSAGLLKGILAILVLSKILADSSDVYLVLSAISDAPFYFLPFLLAVSTAKKFNTNEYLALTVAGGIMYPTILNAEKSLDFLGLSIPAINYSTTVLPVILSVILLSYVQRNMNKVMPNMLRFVLTPICTLLIVMPLVYLFVAPLGMNIGNLLTEASLWIRELSPIVFGIIIGFLYPLIIMTGMHYAFFPILFENISVNGFENIFLPICVVGNMATAACMFAVFFAKKDSKTKSISLSSGISSIFGIIEPALFGIAIPIRKVLFALMIATGIASGILQGMAIKMFSFVAPSLLSIPLFVNPDGSSGNLTGILICILIAVILAFVITYLVIKKEKAKDKGVVFSNGKSL